MRISNHRNKIKNKKQRNEIKKYNIYQTPNTDGHGDKLDKKLHN